MGERGTMEEKRGEEYGEYEEEKRWGGEGEGGMGERRQCSREI